MKFQMHTPHLKKALQFNHAIYLCIFLSCLVPRYISTFKLDMWIDISYYTISVVLIWLLSTRSVVIDKKIECIFFYIWLAFIAFSIWRAENFGIWAYYLDWILTAILLWQIIRKHQDENTYEYIVKALTDALFVHLIIGLYEITTHRYLFEVGNVAPSSYGHVAIGIFYNLNDYATFVTTMIPFAIYRFLISRKTVEKLYCLFLSIASLYLMLINRSRGAILTIMIFVCWLLFMFARKRKRNLLFTGGVLFMFGTLLAFNIGRMHTILLNMISKNTIDINGGTDIVRINLIKNGLYFLKKTYGFGVGAGNLYSWLGDKSIYYIGHLRFMHNWYVEILVTFGVLFFVIYIYFHTKLIYKLFSKRYGVSRLKTTMFLSFICFSVVSISSSSNIYSEWIWMYLVVVSLFSQSMMKVDRTNIRL